jgi:transposase
VAKLSKEHTVTIKVLDERGASTCCIARLLGVTEGAVRYRLGRLAKGAADGRRKPFLVQRLDLVEAVRVWWEAQVERLPADRPPSVEALHAWLQAEHSYRGSYKSVRKYVRSAFPPPKLRPFRRVETPPGAQTQTDWAVFPHADVGDPSGPTTLYALVMTLSHSRKEAVVWSRSTDQLAWHHCHNQAYKRLGGVAAVNRVDNEKTAVIRGAGAWGQINEAYRVYARSLRFHIDACEPRQPQQKGKTERRVGVLRRIDPSGKCYESLEHLQAWSDAKLEAAARARICPATGLSVQESWLAEIPRLWPLPDPLPEPFDIALMRPVHKDCMVHFEGRQYPVPFAFVGEQVEVRGCSGVVQIMDPRSGQVLRSFPRHTQERILIDPTCYEGPATERVAAPRPLGRLARKLQEVAAMPVERRPLDLYAALAEVAR